MRPAFKLFADEVDITQTLASRLLSLTVKDEAETKSDTCAIKIDDRPNEKGLPVAMPEIGTTLRVGLGYRETGIAYLGTYEIDEINYTSPPATMEVSARSANLPTPFRTPTSRSWHGQTLGEVMREIATTYGFTPEIAEALADIPIAHEDQVAESPMAFATRLATAHDAVARPVNGRLLVIPRGLSQAVTGEALPTFILTPALCSQWKFNRKARTAPGQSAQGAPDAQEVSDGGVRTVYWDADEATLREALSGSPPYQTIRFASSDAREAEAVSATVSNDRGRKKMSFSFSCPGNTALMAEQRLVLQGFRPEIPTEWRVTSVEHKFDGGGYVCSADAELFNPAQENVAARAIAAAG